MNKRRIHHNLTVLRRLKTWQLVVIALLLSAVSIGLLRHNSIEAVRLFQDVKQADKTGEDVYETLTELQRYVSHHMNTHLERVTLEETYTRDYQARLQALASSGGVNKNANYSAAQQACAYLESQHGHSAYVQYAKCVEDRLAQVAPGQAPSLEKNLPKPVQYQYNFLSPAWSPDVAGITLLITGAVWLIIIIKVGLQLLLRGLVRRRHQL